MSAAVKTLPINITFKPDTPGRVIAEVRQHYHVYMMDDEPVNWFESELHKEIAGRMTPGKYLKNLREVTGMTQKELGKKVGVGTNYISDWETGQRAIGRVKAKVLAGMFGVSAVVFI